MTIPKKCLILCTAFTMLADASLPVHSLEAPLSVTQASITVPYSCQTVYDSITALEESYPNGTAWTNSNIYNWNGGYLSGGGGCVAFAFILSDAAFGTLPAIPSFTFEPENLRVGDVIRYDYHSFIILEVKESSVIIAEGNINSQVLWGREISFDTISASSNFEHHLTRYPEEFTFQSSTTALEAGETMAAPLISRDAVSLTWTSSNPGAAQVDANGQITAIGAGTTVITAASGTHSESFTVSVTGGTPAMMKGDVDLNGIVNISDATEALTIYAKHSASLSTEEYTDTQLQSADTNEDGLISISDATAILSYYAQTAAGLNPDWKNIIS
ncbi:MAG: Ig-like domain-containing protein [Ruminococcus sp.]|nr:Ig-like domain-containing protein [Ruminococcus sp.]